MAKKKKQFNKGLTIFLAIVLFLLGTAGGFVGYHYLLADRLRQGRQRRS